MDDEFILSIQYHVDAMLMLEHLNDLITFIILDLSTITSNVGRKMCIISHLRNGKCVLIVLLFFDVILIVKSIRREATIISFGGLIGVVVDLRFWF